MPFHVNQNQVLEQTNFHISSWLSFPLSTAFSIPCLPVGVLLTLAFGSFSKPYFFCIPGKATDHVETCLRVMWFCWFHGWCKNTHFTIRQNKNQTMLDTDFKRKDGLKLSYFWRHSRGGKQSLGVYYIQQVALSEQKDWTRFSTLTSMVCSTSKAFAESVSSCSCSWNSHPLLGKKVPSGFQVGPIETQIMFNL